MLSQSAIRLSAVIGLVVFGLKIDYFRTKLNPYFERLKAQLTKEGKIKPTTKRK
jgi:hypothetical protein